MAIKWEFPIFPKSFILVEQYFVRSSRVHGITTKQTKKHVKRQHFIELFTTDQCLTCGLLHSKQVPTSMNVQ